MVKVRHRQPAKGADRPGPKGHAGRIVDWNPRRRWHQDPPDYRTQPPRSQLPIGQQGKPHSSRLRAETRPRGRVTAEGVEDAGESEGRSVMGRIGPREREYPT